MMRLFTDSAPAEILLVEDNENDVELTRQGFKMSSLRLHLHHVKDGEECMVFLRKQGYYADAPTPDLVLLDLNMPRMNGLEVLTQLAKDETLRSMPVVVLTTSAREEEITAVYKLGCRSYIVKPVDFGEFLTVVRAIADYWFKIVVLPGSAMQQAQAHL